MEKMSKLFFANLTKRELQIYPRDLYKEMSKLSNIKEACWKFWNNF